MMPPKGAAARAEASATLSGVIHERFISDEIGRLLDEVAPLETELGHDSDDASLVRVTRREWEKARRVPAEIAAAWAREGGEGARRLARGAREERLLDLPAGAPARARRRAAVGGADGAGRLAVRRVPRRVRAGDDDRRGEGGLRRAPARADRDRARRRRAGGRLVPRGRLSDPRSSRSSWRGILRDFGFEEGAYRLDPTVHPFATSFTGTDIRMTTRYKPDNLRALWAAMHEAGHGLTYQGVDPALGRSPLYGNASLGLGESQSRTWENLVGRSLPVLARPLPRAAAALPAARGGRAR